MDKSMFEIAKEIMGNAEGPITIEELLDEAMKEAGVEDAALRAQLYIDITTSAEFVYCDNDLWDLKERQSLDFWDRSFYESDAVEEDEDDSELTMDDYNFVDDEEDASDNDEESTGDDEDEDEEDEDEVEVYDVDSELEDEEEDEDSSWDDDDEEKYNDMMDDYEDLYDDK